MASTPTFMVEAEGRAIKKGKGGLIPQSLT